MESNTRRGEHVCVIRVLLMRSTLPQESSHSPHIPVSQEYRRGIFFVVERSFCVATFLYQNSNMLLDKCNFSGAAGLLGV